VSQLPGARSFPGDRFAPRIATTWLLENGPPAGLTGNSLARAEICLDELVSNVVRHGGHGARPATLTISLAREEKVLLLTVEDDGDPFDPRQVPEPAFARFIEEAEAGGRGIFLVRSFADDLRYERRAGQNQVTVIFRRAATDPA
jgi:anti-sigma regulatory factor (Ser/Thr protein kinase)